GFDEAMRRHQELQLTELALCRLRLRHVLVVQIPGVIAADQLFLIPLADDRPLTAAARRVPRALHADLILAHRFGAKVDRADEALELETRPGLVQRRAVVLSERGDIA